MLEDNNRTIAKERDALKERVRLYQLEKDAKISKNINSKVGRGKNAFLKSLDSIYRVITAVKLGITSFTGFCLW